MGKSTDEPVLKTLKIWGDVEQNKKSLTGFFKKLDNRAVFSSFSLLFIVYIFFFNVKYCN